MTHVNLSKRPCVQVKKSKATVRFQFYEMSKRRPSTEMESWSVVWRAKKRLDEHLLPMGMVSFGENVMAMGHCECANCPGTPRDHPCGKFWRASP